MFSMEQYRNINGDSGVVAYEIGDNSIKVEFKGAAKYLYTSQSAGASNIAEMHRLALAGSGLNSFISRVVRTK
jgi:hypothetical protein